jgi:hypothetical protein
VQQTGKFVLVGYATFSYNTPANTLSSIPPSHHTYSATIATSDENFQLWADLGHTKLFSNEEPSPKPLQHDNNHLFQSQSAFFTGMQGGPNQCWNSIAQHGGSISNNTVS